MTKPTKLTHKIVITDVNNIPAKYFYHANVVEALRKEIETDVFVHKLRIPSGSELVLRAKQKPTFFEKIKDRMKRNG